MFEDRGMYRLSLLFLGLLASGCPKSTGPTLTDLEKRGHRAVEAAQNSPVTRVVLRNATVMTATGETYSPGYLVFSERIEAVGAGEPPPTSDAHVIDAKGAVVTPGLIDTHSHLGVYPTPRAAAHSDGNEATSPTTAPSRPSPPPIRRKKKGGANPIGFPKRPDPLGSTYMDVTISHLLPSWLGHLSSSKKRGRPKKELRGCTHDAQESERNDDRLMMPRQIG